MTYLIKTVETYTADSEKEALTLIDDAKNASEYDLLKYTNVTKEIKEKGEVVGSYKVVTLTKRFNDEKAPDTEIKVSYGYEE